MDPNDSGPSSSASPPAQPITRGRNTSAPPAMKLPHGLAPLSRVREESRSVSYRGERRPSQPDTSTDGSTSTSTSSSQSGGLLLSPEDRDRKPSTQSSSISFAPLPITRQPSPDDKESLTATATASPRSKTCDEHAGLDDDELKQADGSLLAFKNSASASRRGSAATMLSVGSVGERMAACNGANNYNETLGAYGADSSSTKRDPITPSRTPLVTELAEGTDPLQWSLKFKCWATGVYCAMILSTTYGSSSYAASSVTIEQHWGLSRTLATSGTSLWVLGFAVGPLLFGPTSEVFGRRPVYLASFALLTIANIVACVAPNIEVLLAMRFIGGCMGSSALNNVAASISDMIRVRDRLRYLTMYRIVSFGGPTLGPLFGTFLNQASWRWNLAVLPFFSFATLVLYAATVPESHRVTIARKQLEQRQKEHAKQVEKLCEEGKMTRPTEDRSKRELGGPSLMQRYKTALSMPFVLLFTEPIVGIVCIYTALLYGLLYGIIAAFPLVWQDIRGRSPEYASTVFLTLLGGFCLGAGLIGCWLQDKSYKRQYDAGEVTPESRIGPATWASFCVPVGLFLFGWTAPYDKLVGSLDIHWAVPCVALVIFAFGMQVVFNSWLSYLGDAYAPVAASAMAAATFSRSMLGAAFPLFLRQWMLAWSVQAVFSILGGVSILLSFGGLAFVRYGARIRARSTRATTED